MLEHKVPGNKRQDHLEIKSIEVVGTGMTAGPRPIAESRRKHWVERGSWNGERNQNRAWAAVVWIALLSIAAVVCLWTLLATYESLASTVVFTAAVALFVHKITNRQHFPAALFAGVAVFYNPLFPVFHFADGSALRVVAALSAIPFVFALNANNRLGLVLKSSRFVGVLLLMGLMSSSAAAAASAEAEPLSGELSKYREFAFGSTTATIAKQTGSDPSHLTRVHLRPALIETITWRPPYAGGTETSETVQQVTFTFYNSALFQIAVTYDRYQTEGLTAADMSQALSKVYGKATDAGKLRKTAREPYGSQEEVVASWEDELHRFDLLQTTPSAPSYRLIGVVRAIEAPALKAIAAAERMDVVDAPKREAERAAAMEIDLKAKIEKTRLSNRAKFRP